MLHNNKANGRHRGLFMRVVEKGLTYLQILWEVREEGQDSLIVREANLCKAHREEIFLEHPSARGSGRPGADCDLCKGRDPRRAPTSSPHGPTACPRTASRPPIHLTHGKEAAR